MTLFDRIDDEYNLGDYFNGRSPKGLDDNNLFQIKPHINRYDIPKRVFIKKIIKPERRGRKKKEIILDSEIELKTDFEVFCFEKKNSIKKRNVLGIPMDPPRWYLCKNS